MPGYFFVYRITLDWCGQMRIFVSGGCKNGKSTYAEKFAKDMAKKVPLYYIATMAAVDHEDVNRIQRHRFLRKDMGFITVEQPTNILEILDTCDTNGSFLIDSTTALLANEMFRKNGEYVANVSDVLERDLISLISKLNNVVFVSDYIFSDAAIYDEYTENYRQSLAHLDKTIAKHCDTVLEVSYGNIFLYKGELT